MRSIKAKYMEQQRFSGLLLASVRKSMNLIGSICRLQSCCHEMH